MAGPHSCGRGVKGWCCREVCAVVEVCWVLLLVWISKLQLQFPQPHGFRLLALRQATGPGCPTDTPYTREIAPVLFTAIIILFFSPNS